MTEVDVKHNLELVLTKIKQAADRRPPELQYCQPKLVAVGKTKPFDLIVQAYECGQRNFGENYVQELEDKANCKDALEKCKDIKWHFIGRLQSNKVNKLLALPNLYMIESVHSQKLAKIINNNWPNFRKQNKKLKVMVQVNTSGEDVKNGVEPSEVVEMSKFVINECENLEFYGLMTIGKYEFDSGDEPNPFYILLKKCRDEVSKQLNIDWQTIELSMGMSNDYEEAVEIGSTVVRVGRSIFGDRALKFQT